MLRTFNGLTTNTADMIIYRATEKLERELRTYLTGDKTDE